MKLSQERLEELKRELSSQSSKRGKLCPSLTRGELEAMIDALLERKESP